MLGLIGSVKGGNFRRRYTGGEAECQEIPQRIVSSVGWQTRTSTTTLRALLRRKPGIDLVRVQDCGLSGATDPEILAWAAAESRIILTHDVRTFSAHAYARVVKG
jgi:Domain of unknown function (DUF5615)